MTRRPPRVRRTDPRWPFSTLYRSVSERRRSTLNSSSATAFPWKKRRLTTKTSRKIRMKGPMWFGPPNDRRIFMADRPLAIVTGASTGIGLELAKCCAGDGYDLIIAANEPEIEATARELRQQIGRAHV